MAMKDDDINGRIIDLIRQARAKAVDARDTDAVISAFLKDETLHGALMGDAFAVNRIIAKGLRRTIRELKRRDPDDWR